MACVLTNDRRYGCLPLDISYHTRYLVSLRKEVLVSVYVLMKM